MIVFAICAMHTRSFASLIDWPTVAVRYGRFVLPVDY